MNSGIPLHPREVKQSLGGHGRTGLWQLTSAQSLLPGEQTGCCGRSPAQALCLSRAPLPPKPSGFVEGQIQLPTLITTHQAWTERLGGAQPCPTPPMPLWFCFVNLPVSFLAVGKCERGFGWRRIAVQDPLDCSRCSGVA